MRQSHGRRITRLFLVRHGETEANCRGAYLGWEDVPLSERGRRQATALALMLAGTPASVICSSDLCRARDTAAAIAARHDLTATCTPALRELNFGDWSGLTYAAIAARDPDRLRAWVADPTTNAPPNGETLAELVARVRLALPSDADAIVVTHGGPLRALLALWTGRPFWEFDTPTGCCVTVELERGRLLSHAIHVPLE